MKGLLPYGAGKFFSLMMCRLICMFYCLSMSSLHRKLGNKNSTKIALQLYAPRLTSFLFFILFCLHTFGLISSFLKKNCFSKTMEKLYSCVRRMWTNRGREGKKDRRKSKVPFLDGAVNLKDYYAQYFGEFGIYGRKGRRYENRIMLRELVEIPSQTYQAYMMSLYISDYRFATAYGAFIIFDCIMVPLIMQNRQIQMLSRRNAILILDIFVDVMGGTVFPMLAILPPLNTYFTVPGIAKDEVWLASAVASIKYLMVSSFIDLWVSVIPLVFSHFALNTVNQNFTDLSAFLNADPVFRSMSKTPTSTQVLPHAEATETRPSRAIDKDSISQCDSHLAKINVMLKKMFSICSLIWGTILLIIVVSAPYQDACAKPVQNNACRLKTFPWHFPFYKAELDCYCLFVEMDCKTNPWLLPEDGLYYDSINQLLKYNFKTSTTILTIRNCAMSQPPKAITLHAQLFMINIERCYMDGFDLITENMHNLITLRLRGNRFEKLPMSLSRIPKSLLVLLISDTNLTRIPEWTIRAWDSLGSLSLINCSLVKFPNSIPFMKGLARVSMENNFIKHIPPTITNLQLLHTLRLANNSISKLPIELATLPLLTKLTLTLNNISTVLDLPWKKDEILQWSTWPTGLLTLSYNPICKNMGPEGLHGSIFCEEACSPLCDVSFATNHGCDAYCNTTECDFDSHYCVDK